MEHDRSSGRDQADRGEVYERIPWEHLERRANDRQWLYVGVAGAVALGVLAYSFVRNQPTQPSSHAGSVVSTEAESIEPPAQSAPDPAPTISSPVVVAEADLYALDPDRLIAAAATHAEWFAVEYFAVDGSPTSAETLRSLLPDGLPLPEAPEGVQVYVDWVGARQVTRLGDVDYEVEVLVRSLLSTESSGFVRQPVRMLRVQVGFGSDGEPRVLSAPLVLEAPFTPPALLDLADVPPEVAARIDTDAELIGGDLTSDGAWSVVVMRADADGVKRPQLVDVP